MSDPAGEPVDPVSVGEVRERAPRPVEVTVSGCLVSFNGVPTLWLNEPTPIADVLADPLTQRVRAAYAEGWRHRA